MTIYWHLVVGAAHVALTIADIYLIALILRYLADLWPKTRTWPAITASLILTNGIIDLTRKLSQKYTPVPQERVCVCLAIVGMSILEALLCIIAK